MMLKENLQKAFEATKMANTVFSKAGGIMLKSSLKTAREIAKLYKEAGSQAFSTGKGVVKKTVQLTVANQKELLKTSSGAIKEVAQNLRKQEADEQEEVTIDDLLDDE